MRLPTHIELRRSSISINVSETRKQFCKFFVQISFFPGAAVKQLKAISIVSCSLTFFNWLCAVLVKRSSNIYFRTSLDVIVPWLYLVHQPEILQGNSRFISGGDYCFPLIVAEQLFSQSFEGVRLSFELIRIQWTAQSDKDFPGKRQSAAKTFNDHRKFETNHTKTSTTVQCTVQMTYGHRSHVAPLSTHIQSAVTSYTKSHHGCIKNLVRVRFYKLKH